MTEIFHPNDPYDERMWNADLTEGARNYEDDRDRLFDAVNDKTVGNILDWDDEIIRELSAVALEVEKRGELNSLMGSRGQGALQLARELIAYAKQHELDKVA